MLEPGAVARVVLERVDRDDAPVVVGEGVAVGGDLPLDAAQSLGVEAHEGEGEARPEFALELREHALDGDDENAPRAPALGELGEQDAELDGFTEARSVGEEDARAEAFEGLPGRHQLVGHHVERGAMGEVHLRVGGRRATEEGLEEESRAAVAG